MNNAKLEYEKYANTVGGFLLGLLIGGLAGAGTMLLLAPQSGKRTRTLIQRKSLELRDQTTEAVEDAVEQARDKTRQITGDIQEKAKELEHRGQALFDEQKKLWSPA